MDSAIVAIHALLQGTRVDRVSVTIDKKRTRYGQCHCGHPAQTTRGTDSAYEAIGMTQRFYERLQECHWHTGRGCITGMKFDEDRSGANQRHKMRTWESAGFRNTAIQEQQEPTVSL
jgi:hypothetical protein